MRSIGEASFIEPMLLLRSDHLPDDLVRWQSELLCGPPHNNSSVAQSVMWLPRIEAGFTGPQLKKTHNIIEPE
jgi:hypothetical protein